MKVVPFYGEHPSLKCSVRVDPPLLLLLLL
jgi:hypothetical protein